MGIKYNLLKNIVGKKCREIYDQNVKNLQNIVEILEHHYDITISRDPCVPEVKSTTKNYFFEASQRSKDLTTFSLADALTVLMNADLKKMIPFPRIRKPVHLTSYPKVTVQEAGLFKDDK